MSGDVQPRKRKDKDKKKKKSQLDLEDLDGDGASDRFLNVEDEDAGDLPPGGDCSHDVADDHGHHGSASWCGKVIFLTLLAALLVGAGLVFFESWGKSFNEVSIADSRFADIFKGLLEERDEHEDDHIAEHFSHDDEDDEEIEAMLNGGEWHEVGSPLTTKLMARFELTARQFPLTEYEGVSRRRTEVFERIYSKGGLSREDGRRLKNEIDELRKLLVSSRRKKRASKVVGDDSVQSSSTRVVAGQTADPLASVSATQFEPMPEQILLTKTEDIQPIKEERASTSSTVVPQAPVVESSVIKDTPVSSNQHGVTLDPTSASHASTGPLKTSTVDDVTSSTLGRDVPSYLLETSAEEASEDEADSDSRTSDQPGASTAVPEPVQEESFTSSFWPLSGGTHEPEPQVVEEPPPDSEEEEEEIEADTDDPSEAAVTEAPSVEVGEEAKPAEVDEGYASEQEESESEAAVGDKPAVMVEETTPEPAVPVEEATPEERKESVPRSEPPPIPVAEAEPLVERVLPGVVRDPAVHEEVTAPEKPEEIEGVETPQPVSEPPPAIQVTEAPVERLVEAEVLPDLSSQPPVHEEVTEPEKPEEIKAETPKLEELPPVQEEPAAPVGTSEEESTPSTSTSSPSRDSPPSQYSSSYSQQPSGNPWENEVSDDEAAAPPIDEEVAQDEVIAESAEEQQQANPWDNYEFKDITNEEDFEIRDELDELDRLYAETKTGSEVRKVMFKYEELMKKKPNSPRALHGVGLCLDRLAFYEKSNALLDQSLATMQKIVALGPYVPDELLRRVLRTLYDKMKFRGHVYKGIPILLQAVEKFPGELEWRHYLIVAYLTVGRNDDAKLILKDTMSRWPDDGYSKVHYGFLLKLVDKNYKTGAKFMQDGIDSKQPGTQDGRFFYHLGDAYMRLGEMDKMKATYEAGEKNKLFLSAQQRSLHNVEHLTGRPWWTVQQTTYGNELKKLASEWRTIRKEGLTVLGLKKNGFKDESESLLDTGDWKEFTLWARGKKQEEHCKRTPQTCKLLEDFQAAVTCKQGQIKFSVMKPGTHIWAHTGPTNARIRGHLGLAGVDGAKIRVGDQIGEWKEGDFIVFDDSFDHEVWHEGNKTRLVLIVDMWHPELTEQEKASLSPI